MKRNDLKLLETYKGINIYLGKNCLGDEAYIFYSKNGIECSYPIRYTMKWVKQRISCEIKIGNL